MTHTDYVAKIAAATNLPKTVIDSVLKSAAATAIAALNDGGDVSLPGLGKLTLVDRPAKMGRNPRTGEPLQIAAKRVVKFKASKALADNVS